jgi:hypothetical protein
MALNAPADVNQLFPNLLYRYRLQGVFDPEYTGLDSTQ